MNKVDVLLGLQWGDEGKGKIVDVLTPNYDIIARFNGGPNAGHTLEFNGIKHVLHIIPSGICRKDKENVIGNGVLIEPVIFQEEISSLEKIGFSPKDNLLISDKAHLILPTHRLLDAANEKSKGDRKIGSTLKGIGPAYTDKIARTGIRVGDIFENDFQKKYNKTKESHINIIKSLGYSEKDFLIDKKSLEDYEKEWFLSVDKLRKMRITNTEYYINEAIKQGKKVLAEGAQGTMLDIDFGSYPFVTSSSTITAGVCSGLGIAPQKIDKVYGIVKAYCTRVGSGPFPTELFDKDGEVLRDKGREFGATTGRPRRCGWLDMVALNYACMLNGVTDLMLMKIDVLNDFSTIKICNEYKIKDKATRNVPYNMEENKIEPIYTEYKGWQKDISGIDSYEKLPQTMKDYIKVIETNTNVPVTVISISPDRKDTIFRKNINK